MYKEMSIAEFLDQAAARQPMPGGGAISAVGAAVGTSMISTAANFTLGKKGYEDVQDEVKRALEEVETIRQELLAAADKDAAAYENMVAARRKMREAEKAGQEADRAAYDRAVVEATDVPLGVVRACSRCLQVARSLVDIANKWLLGDLAIGVLLVEAGLLGARISVLENVGSIPDEAKRINIINEINAAARVAGVIKQEVLQKIGKDVPD